MTMHYLPGHLFNVRLNLLGAIKTAFQDYPRVWRGKGIGKIYPLALILH